MKYIPLLALIALVSAPLGAKPALAGRAPARIEEQIARIARQARVPGLVVAKVERGKIRWHSAFGERSPGAPMTVDTTFNVASLTKPVFAAAALTLVADGGLALDEKVSNYWIDPDIAADARHERLTPRLLLSHQSGFPNWRGDRPLAFLFDPGQRQEYSGEGYDYLRRAIERKTGRALPDLLADTVFRRAGMSSTHAGWSDSIGENVAAGFDERAQPIDRGLTARRPSAAANLMSAVDDYARFIAWVNAGADLPNSLFDDLRRSQAVGPDPAELFGLGWKLAPLKREMALLHDGREPGVRTFAIALPKSGEGLVIFTNSSNGELTFRPLVRAALAQGDAVLRSMDRLVWRYVTHQPPQALPPMSKGIARSPTFLSTLLHSIDTVFIQPSGLSRREKALAAERVDAYVFARLEGAVDASRAEMLVARLLVRDGDALRLRTSFDDDAARAWVEALKI